MLNRAVCLDKKRCVDGGEMELEDERSVVLKADVGLEKLNDD